MERLVHLVPLGWERDRAVKPILEAHAHRVYLLVRTDHELTDRFTRMVSKDLEVGVPKDAIHIVPLDNKNEFDSVLMHIARLILKERSEGNRVYISMGASGKVAAAAATLAAMYHDEHIGALYYAKSDAYTVQLPDATAQFQEHGLSIGYRETVSLPRFRIQRPRESAVRALATLYNKGPLTINQLILELKELKVDPFHAAEVSENPTGPDRYERAKETLRWGAKLRRLVLNEIIEEGLVRQTARGDGGKVRLELTRDGEYHALISGFVEELHPKDTPSKLHGRRSGGPLRP